MSAPNLERFATFIAELDALVSTFADERVVLAAGGRLLETLVRTDDWLPGAYAASDPARYQQHLLYRDPRGRFSVVSFVWRPGQATPVHDHTVWGLVGVLRGAELSQAYQTSDLGLEPKGPQRRIGQGEVEAVSPSIGDIHRVANASDESVTVSIHVYGGDIGVIARSTFDEAGRRKGFVSGYAATTPPDLGAFGLGGT